LFLICIYKLYLELKLLCHVEFQNKRKRNDKRNVCPFLNYIPSGIKVCILRQQEREKEKLPLLCETGRWARQRERKIVIGWERDLKQIIRKATRINKVISQTHTRYKSTDKQIILCKYIKELMS